MSRNRIIITILTLTILCAASAAGESSSGPSLGKWEFTGKDDTGVAWTGTLTIAKLDPDRFDTNKYHSMCSLEVKSASMERGVEAPCKYEPGARAVSFSTGVDTISSYTAVLSADGKALTEGKWTETKKADRRSGQPASVVNNGSGRQNLPHSRLIQRQAGPGEQRVRLAAGILGGWRRESRSNAGRASWRRRDRRLLSFRHEKSARSTGPDRVAAARRLHLKLCPGPRSRLV